MYLNQEIMTAINIKKMTFFPLLSEGMIFAMNSEYRVYFCEKLLNLVNFPLNLKQSIFTKHLFTVKFVFQIKQTCLKLIEITTIEKSRSEE